MKKALDEANRRRELQRRYNQERGITPQTVKRNTLDVHMAPAEADWVTVPVTAEGAEYQPEQIPGIVAGLEVQMRKAAEEMEFEKAAQLRDRILSLKEMQLGVKSSRIGIKGLLGSGAVATAEALGGARGQRSAARRRRR